MKKVQKQLLTLFWLIIALAFAMVLAGELITHDSESWRQNLILTFHLLMAMELILLLCTPLALKMFKIKFIETSLKQKGNTALLRYGTIRILLLGIPLLLNASFYALTKITAYGYMGIILFLCLFFVYPSLDRCTNETTNNTEDA